MFSIRFSQCAPSLLLPRADIEMTHIPTSVLPFPELAAALPLEDVLALCHLSSAREARIWTRNRIEECKKQLDALIVIQNTITPINTLPNELLTKVFTSIPVYSWCSAPWMLSMSHICRRWRTVVLATPEFWVKPLGDWTDIYNEYELNHLLPLFLKRSSPCPLQLYELHPTSDRSYHGWAPHFGRLTVLEASTDNMWDAPKVLRKVTAKMNHLRRLKLDVQRFSGSWVDDPVTEFDLQQWDAKSLPHLRCLEISGDFFCRAMAVPSLRKLVLIGPRTPKSFPRLFDALKGCPALVKAHFDFDREMDIMNGYESGVAPSPDSVLDLPNLREIRVAGMVPVIHAFLSHISFPAAVARVELIRRDLAEDPTTPPVLLDILPRHLSVLHMSPTIDRLFLQSDVGYKSVPFLCVRGYVQGAERLRVSPVVWLHTAHHLIQLLEVFKACTVTELAVDLRHIASDMSGEFWSRFFAALPDLRRLQLLSCTLESREIKRDIADHFLASCRESQRTAQEISLAWAVRADKTSSHLEEELADVEQVFHRHAECGGRIGRLELMGTSREPSSVDPKYDHTQAVDVSQVSLDRTTRWFLERFYVSQLAEVAEVVTVSGQLKLRPVDEDDDEDDEDEFEGDGTNGDDEPEKRSSEEGENEYGEDE